MFKIRFEVVEIRPSGVRVTHFMRGKRKDINNDIKMFKENCKEYKMVGKNGMIVWV